MAIDNPYYSATVHGEFRLAELRVIDDLHGHAALFGLSPSYGPQIDAALSELLASPV